MHALASRCRPIQEYRAGPTTAVKIPTATYRLQFTPEFGFGHARAALTYLHDLGISDIYASPIFHARSGSAHGYDVVDSNRLNPELGSHAEFEALVDASAADANLAGFKTSCRITWLTILKIGC